MRLHVVDGTFELFRAHFVKRPDHVAPDGRQAKATLGMAASLLHLLNDPVEAVTHLAVAFDNPIRSFRNRLFDGYKTEEGVDPELLSQFGMAEEAVRSLGVVVWSMDEWEADDALATAAARYRASFEQVRIMTPDKDLGQCVSGKEVVQIDRMRQREIDEQAVMARWGVLPASIPDLLALVGDDADGVPGLAGFGERSAAVLLKTFGHLEQIPDDVRRWPLGIRAAARLAKTLADNRERALLYRELTTLVTDVPLTESADDLTFRGAPSEAFGAWCVKLGADNLRQRVRWRGDDSR